MKMDDAHEVAARWRKVAHLAVAVLRLGLSVEQVRAASQDDRALVAGVARVHIPSEETWGLVFALIEQSEGIPPVDLEHTP